jgi:stage II sporulation protein D
VSKIRAVLAALSLVACTSVVATTTTTSSTATSTPAAPTPPPSTTPAPSTKPPAESPPATPPAAPPRTIVMPSLGRDAGGEDIRVVLRNAGPVMRVTSPGGLVFTERDGRQLVARGRGDEPWRIERDGRRVRAVRSDGLPTVWTEPPLIARAERGGVIALNGRGYRGELALYGQDSGVVAVNRVRIDDYLRSVVPLEIGSKSFGDSAAIQAQAVTARSYAYIHLSKEPSRIYDVTDGVQDQVYGGIASETPAADRAVEATRGLVLKYAGRVVNAPYHSTCGGTTAAASEVWRSGDEPYLTRVSDRVPGTDRFYCDIGSRFRWTRTLDAATLNAAIAQYLATYTAVPAAGPGFARDMTVLSKTLSGRVAALSLTTSRGRFTLRGNDIRYVLRPPGGEILNSTYFSVEPTTDLDGSIARLMLRGTGYGHGVGMCQWGAIGRARAGQDFRTILHTYYPGTTVGTAN